MRADNRANDIWSNYVFNRCAYGAHVLGPGLVNLGNLTLGHLTLAGFEAALRFVDDKKLALAAHQPIVTVA